MSWSVSRCLLVALIVIAGNAAVAQAQSFKWWQSDRFQRELALSADQIARLEEIYQGAAPSMKAQKDTLARLQGDLSKLYNDGRADDATANDLIARVEAARSDLGRTRSLMYYRMRRILTSDQHLKLKVLFDEHDRERKGPPRGLR